MELTLAVNNNSVLLANQLKKYAEEKCPLLEVQYHNEDIYKEKQKAFKLKGGYGARQVPFALLYDTLNKKPVKAFYSEVGECTLDNIINHLDKFISY